MKQQITLDQLEECSHILKWMDKKNYGLLPTIGQMIEFLEEHGWLDIEIGIKDKICFVHCLAGLHGTVGRWFSGESKCDALWEAVKATI